MEAANSTISDSWLSIDEPDTRLGNGYQAAQKIFMNHSDVLTAVFAANDAMAIGCMQYLKEARMKVPNDVAIVGFDNVEAALHVEPRLTTMNVHREAMLSIHYSTNKEV